MASFFLLLKHHISNSEKFISKKISFNCLESSLALQKCVQIEVCTHKKAGERHVNSERLSKSASFKTVLGDARILMETEKWLQKFCHNIYLYIQSYYRVSKECNLTIQHTATKENRTKLHSCKVWKTKKTDTLKDEFRRKEAHQFIQCFKSSHSRMEIISDGLNLV